DQDARVQPPHVPAGAHRRDPRGRAVQDHLAHQGPRGAGAVVEVHEPGQGLRLGQASGYLSEEGLMKRLLLLLLVAWPRGPLASPDAETRRGAAMKLGHQADAAAATVVEAAIARERVERVRHALQEALALIRLAHGAPAVRILAAQSLGDLRSFDAMPALQKLAVDAAASPAERDAAIQAIRQIERWSLLVRTVETVFQGASLASILLLMAL